MSAAAEKSLQAARAAGDDDELYVQAVFVKDAEILGDIHGQLIAADSGAAVQMTLLRKKAGRQNTENKQEETYRSQTHSGFIGYRQLRCQRKGTQTTFRVKRVCGTTLRRQKAISA